jgi:hypothetical protein
VRGGVESERRNTSPWNVDDHTELNSILNSCQRNDRSTGDRSVYDGNLMEQHRIFAMSFASVYPLYVRKAEAKSRTKEEVDEIIFWLTGYDEAGLEKQIQEKTDFRTFFGQAPRMNPNVSLIKGVVCGIRVEDIEDPLMQKIRYLDKLIDELAKGKKMEKILRSSE